MDTDDLKKIKSILADMNHADNLRDEAKRISARADEIYFNAKKRLMNFYSPAGPSGFEKKKNPQVIKALINAERSMLRPKKS